MSSKEFDSSFSYGISGIFTHSPKAFDDKRQHRLRENLKKRLKYIAVRSRDKKGHACI